MVEVTYSPGVTQADLDAAAAKNLDIMAQRIPALATTPPPAVTSGSNVAGTSDMSARSDHTHKSSVQRARVSVPLTSGKGTWTFAQPYDVGVIPVIQTTVETPNDPTFVYDAKIVAGTATNTSVQIIVNKFMAAQTLGATLTALLGSVVQIFQPATGTVIVDCWAAPATT